MVAIKGKVLSNNLWTTHARVKNLERAAYGSVKLRMSSLAHNTSHCHHADYSHSFYDQVVPILQLVYNTNEVSLISKLEKGEIIEIECSSKHIHQNRDFEVVKKNVKFYNLIIFEKEVFLSGVPCRTISSCIINPVSKYKHNWKKSSRDFVSRLTKLNPLILASEEKELTELMLRQLEVV